jgi:hypothetical protein
MDSVSWACTIFGPACLPSCLPSCLPAFLQCGQRVDVVRSGQMLPWKLSSAGGHSPHISKIDRSAAAVAGHCIVCTAAMGVLAVVARLTLSLYFKEGLPAASARSICMQKLRQHVQVAAQSMRAGLPCLLNVSDWASAHCVLFWLGLGSTSQASWQQVVDTL